MFERSSVEEVHLVLDYREGEPGMADSTTVFRITNSIKNDIILHLEPWGEQSIMPAGKVFKVEATGPNNDLLELEYGEGKLVLYGWPGAVLTISEDAGLKTNRGGPSATL